MLLGNHSETDNRTTPAARQYILTKKNGTTTIELQQRNCVSYAVHIERSAIEAMSQLWSISQRATT
jgi:hypothetical protein